MSKISVWWLTDTEARAVVEARDSNVPQYVLSELAKPRERKDDWEFRVHSHFSGVRLYWDLENQTCCLIAGSRAIGIAVANEDVAALPEEGFLTNLECTRVNCPPMS